MLRRIFQRLRALFTPIRVLEDAGERVDIEFSSDLDFSRLDLYQKSHFSRYMFALDQIPAGGICGDFACGTGYGTAMLSQRASRAIGADRNGNVIAAIRQRYARYSNLEYVEADLFALPYKSLFDAIVSFETIEHFEEEDIVPLLKVFSSALKPGGTLIFSTPFRQERTPEALKLGFHKTFDIDQGRIRNWLLQVGLTPQEFYVQDYRTHRVVESLEKPDFIICMARLEAA